ncbi:MAG: hypothetical protein C0514_04530 [Candidatus Puniceispirillum sp.]|nr:hypothetical protein [Candidatus Puniceispirillum sp.]
MQLTKHVFFANGTSMGAVRAQRTQQYCEERFLHNLSLIYLAHRYERIYRFSFTTGTKWTEKTMTFVSQTFSHLTHKRAW